MPLSYQEVFCSKEILEKVQQWAERKHVGLTIRVHAIRWEDGEQGFEIEHESQLNGIGSYTVLESEVPV